MLFLIAHPEFNLPLALMILNPEFKLPLALMILNPDFKLSLTFTFLFQEVHYHQFHPNVSLCDLWIPSMLFSL